MDLVSQMCKWQVDQIWILPATVPPTARSSSPLREQQGSSSCRASRLCWKVLPLECCFFYGVPHASLWRDELGRGRANLQWWCWPQMELQISELGGLASTPASQQPGSAPSRARWPDYDQDYRNMDTKVRTLAPWWDLCLWEQHTFLLHFLGLWWGQTTLQRLQGTQLDSAIGPGDLSNQYVQRWWDKVLIISTLVPSH